jgi:hypothetical protein
MNTLDSLSSLISVPVLIRLLILVVMPAGATIAGWLLAGRELVAFARQPLE